MIRPPIINRHGGHEKGISLNSGKDALADGLDEIFRVLKEKQERLYGEYRTRRLVLEESGEDAWRIKYKSLIV